MDIYTIMSLRKSRRSYNGNSLNENHIKIINDEIEKGLEKYQVKAKLIVGNNDCFKSLHKTYGFFTGVNNYIIMYGKKDYPYIKEEVGMFGEELILKATEIELGTCWVGGTYDKNACSIHLHEDEDIVCVITIGEVKDKLTFKESLISKVTKRSTKSIEEMLESDVQIPLWIKNGMKAVQLAPSAVNRQPVKFIYKNNILRASVDDINSYQGIDLGIAKLHFNLGSNVGEFEKGNNAIFIYNK